MGAKIRNAELDRIPIMIIVGENEVNDNTIFVGTNQGIEIFQIDR